MREKILWHLWPLPLWNTANEMDDELPVFKDFPWNPSFSSSLWGFCRWLVVQQCARIPFPVSLGGGATGWFLGGREVVATPRLAHQPRCRHEESGGPAALPPPRGLLQHLGLRSQGCLPTWKCHSTSGAVLASAGIIKIRGMKRVSASCLWCPAHSYSLSLYFYLLPQHVPNELRVQHGMWRQWPHRDCLGLAP